MVRWKALAVVSAGFISSNLTAQIAGRPIDPVFARAQALVSDGNGAAGRALIDSMLRATPPSAPLYPQALFWRASLAASAADAESDYKHIVVDYPLTQQAPDALLRLAQLELARGDRDAALGHLQRIPRDYPNSKSLARANYWIARVFFEKNDVVNGCAANANAVAKLDSNEVELRNQIQYQGQRCPTPAPSAAVTGTAVVAPVTATNVQEPVTKVSDSVAVRIAAVDTARPTPPAVEATDTKPAVVDAPKAVLAAKAEYSVQVAAYKTRTDADKLTESLKKRGFEARVDESPDWFRVRIGRYATEGAAEEKLREMKTNKMTGFVVRVPNR
ncbi:MAG TPA: SPOR domain-containing protein [Gemmatimonadaceae bacterium]|nr:SPOR domain-containing protein [Gemmatimonadaceae bacterium]